MSEPLAEVGWIADWRPRTTSNPESNLIGLLEREGHCLLRLQTHYDFIVYLFYSLWRKTIIMLHDDQGDANRRPPLHGVHLPSPCHLGTLGALNRLHTCLPKVFLEERRPVSLASIQSAAEDEPNEFGSFLRGAISSDQRDVVCILLQQLQVSVNDDWDLLHTAAGRGLIQMVELLVHHGAEVDAMNLVGRTPLAVAAGKGHTEAIDTLINHGVEVDAKDLLDQTPLHNAGCAGHQAVINALTTHGAKVDAQDQFGETPLFTATRSGHKEAIEALIRHGAELDAKNPDGRTALHVAAYGNGGLRDQAGAVEALLRHGATVDVKDNTGITPFDIAEKHGHEEFVELLAGHRTGGKSGAAWNRQE